MKLFDTILSRFSGNKRKLIANVIWAMSGKVVNMFGQLFVGILVARYLGPEQYGLMNYVISYVALFTIIATFGLSNIEVRELSKSPEHRDEIIGTAFRLRLFFATIGYLLVVSTTLLSKADSFTTTMILLYALSLYSGCFEVIRNYFTSIVKNEYVVKSEMMRTVIGASIKLLLLWLKAPLEFFIIATLFDTVLVASGYCVSYKTQVGKISDWKYNATMAPYLAKQAFPLVLSGAAVIIYQRIDQVMIGNMIDKESVGYFSTAGRFLELILFLPHVLTQTITPLLVKSYNKDDGGKEYAIKSLQFVSLVVWVAIIISSIVSMSSYWLIKYTFGEKYMASVPVLSIIAFKTVGMALSSSGGQLIIIEKIQKWAVIKNLIGCAACVGLNYLFIPKYGIIGSAWVTIITLSISGCLGNVFIPPYHHILKIELKAIFLGWRELFYIRKIMSK